MFGIVTVGDACSYGDCLYTDYSELTVLVNLASITIMSKNPVDCKEANMQLYFYLRSRNYNPIIQV